MLPWAGDALWMNTDPPIVWAYSWPTPTLTAPSLRPLPGAEGGKGRWAGEAAENLPVRKGGEDVARDGAVHEPRLLAPAYTLHCPMDFTYKAQIQRETS